MRRVLAYSVLLLCAYAVFLLSQFPATHLYAWLKPRGEAPAELYQISGSIWRGRAAVATIGRTRIDAPQWAFRPRALLLGRVEYELAGRLGRTPVSGIAGRSLNNPFYATDTRAAMPLTELLRLTGLGDIGLTGQFSAEIRRLEIRAKKISAIDATLSIADAVFGPPVNMALGSATMRLESSKEVIRGVLKDNGGPLQADGILTYQPSGEYQFTLNLSARDPSDVQLRQALHMFGTPNSAGKVSLSRRGRFDLGSYL